MIGSAEGTQRVICEEQESNPLINMVLLHNHWIFSKTSFKNKNYDEKNNRDKLHVHLRQSHTPLLHNTIMFSFFLPLSYKYIIYYVFKINHLIYFFLQYATNSGYMIE